MSDVEFSLDGEPHAELMFDEVVSKLEFFLEKTKTGNLSGIFLVTLQPNGSVDYGWSCGGSSATSMIGAVEIAKSRLLKDANG
jgi:hypothetical protein